MTPSFPQRLKERKLVQWALAYLAGAWVLLQVLDLVGDRFGWPDALLRSLIVLLTAGFFVVLVLAWYHGEKGRQRVGGMEVLMLAGILVLAGAAVAWVGSGAAEGTAAEGRLAAAPPASAAEQGSIAVLPFANLSHEREQEYFSDGLTEELLNALAQVPGLRVAARTSSFAFKGQNVPVDSVARVLRVAHVLEGSVRRSGERLRITAQLIHAREGHQLWSQTYERQLADVFEIQDEISRAIVEQLRLRLAGGANTLVTAPTQDLGAYEAYLRGLHFLNQRRIPSAIEQLEQAIRQDPGYARAHAALAEAYSLLAAYSDLPPLEVRRKGIAAAEAALRLDPSLADAHAARGYLEMIDFRWEEAGRSLRRAIELDPRAPRARFYHAVYLHRQGRPEDALHESQRARNLDPLSLPINSNHAVYLISLGRGAEAKAQSEAVLELDPDFPINLVVLGVLLQATGEPERAVPVFERLAERVPSSIFAGFLGSGYARAGRPADARRVLEQLKARAARGEYVSQGAIGWIYLELGEREQGFAWLERAVEARDLFLVVWGVMTDDSLTQPYRDDPRFQRLRRQMGLAP